MAEAPRKQQGPSQLSTVDYVPLRRAVILSASGLEQETRRIRGQAAIFGGDLRLVVVVANVANCHPTRTSTYFILTATGRNFPNKRSILGLLNAVLRLHRLPLEQQAGNTGVHGRGWQYRTHTSTNRRAIQLVTARRIGFARHSMSNERRANTGGQRRVRWARLSCSCE